MVCSRFRGHQFSELHSGHFRSLAFPFVFVIVSCFWLVVVIVSYISLFSTSAQKRTTQLAVQCIHWITGLKLTLKWPTWYKYKENKSLHGAAIFVESVITELGLHSEFRPKGGVPPRNAARKLGDLSSSNSEGWCPRNLEHIITWKRIFFIHPGDLVSDECIFGQQKHWIHVYGRPKCTRLFHHKIVSVWTGPQWPQSH